jgi:hypothetical protein
MGRYGVDERPMIDADTSLHNGGMRFGSRWDAVAAWGGGLTRSRIEFLPVRCASREPPCNCLGIIPRGHRVLTRSLPGFGDGAATHRVSD